MAEISTNTSLNKNMNVPDLSHLTEEERKIIESVMLRQKQEEDEEAQVLKKKQDEVMILENAIRKRNEEQKKLGLEMEATCQICLKTKFADGVGHICNYCNTRCCARCGGKVTLRSNKNIWVCILCRKKQELLIKTGQWIHSSMANRLKQLEAEDDTPIIDANNQISSLISIGRRGSLGLPSRPQLNKELRRQFSQESQLPHQSVNDNWSERRVKPLVHHILPFSPQSKVLLPNLLQTTQRQMPEIPTRRFEKLDSMTQSKTNREMDSNVQSGRKLPRQRSNENWKLYDGNGNLGCNVQNKQLPMISSENRVMLRDRTMALHNTSIPVPSQLIDNNSIYDKKMQLFSSNGFPKKNHLDPSSATLLVLNDKQRINNSVNRRKSTAESVIRNDSLSSDQSECVRPPPPKPHKSRYKLGKKLRPYSSLSSSDEEVKSTPECSTEEDQDIESESISEKGDHIDKNLKCQRIMKPEEILDAKIKKFLAHPITWNPSSDGIHLIGHMILKKHLSDDSVSSSSATILGLKVVGGRIIESGRLGAIIEKVKKGSIADTIGRLRPGDEVVEWNGRSLQGKTYEEVYDIIAESKQEPQVELIVSRATHKLPLLSFDQQQFMPQTRIGRRHTDIIVGNQTASKFDKSFMRGSSLGADFTRHNKPHLKVMRSSTISGRIQVKLWYDIQSLQLVVTIVGAIELSPRKTGFPRCPYAKMFLLPDRSEKSKRRTKTIANSNEPKWNQTFVYCPLRRSEMKSKALEITIWDYDRYGANDFLGEIIIELSTAPLDDEGEWYLLASREDIIAQIRQQPKPYLNPFDRLSPPSTISRLSDSDISELDYDEGFNTSRESWTGLLADTSQSSLGSSGSPPLLPNTEPKPNSRQNVYDYFARETQRRDRYDATASLPANYIVSEPNNVRFRPEFRKSSSQPTRSLSPPSLRSRSPSKSIETPSGSVLLNKKRHLPQVPKVKEHNQLEDRSRYYKTNLTQKKFTDPLTPLTMYSDSEINTKPVFGDRPIYGHQHQRRDSSNTHSSGHYYTKSARNSRRPSTGHYDEYQSENEIQSKDRDIRDYRDRLNKSTANEGESGEESENSAFSNVSERPRGSRTLSEFTTRIQSYGPVHPPHPTYTPHSSHSSRTSIAITLSERENDDKLDGTLSDTAIGSFTKHTDSQMDDMNVNCNPSSATNSSSMFARNSGLTKKSNSTSQLSVSGTKKRLGFRRKQVSSFSVHRSEEVLPDEVRHLVKQCSSASSDGEGSLSGDSSATWVPSMRLASEGEFSNFVEGLGPGQIVGRQALASPNLGDIQLSLCDRKGNLEVEVIRARGLQAKQTAKLLPAPYVKVYLVKERKCISKAKTATARRTLDPLYQQQLIFSDDYRGCTLQVTIWGDYGRMDKKTFMGVAQIVLDDLELSNIVIGWYKLFNTSSVISLPTSGKASNSLMSTSLESFS